MLLMMIQGVNCVRMTEQEQLGAYFLRKHQELENDLTAARDVVRWRNAELIPDRKEKQGVNLAPCPGFLPRRFGCVFGDCGRVPLITKVHGKNHKSSHKPNTMILA